MPDPQHPDVDRLLEQCADLLAALKRAKNIIRAWHGEVAWDLYDRESPEMKQINAAIANAERAQ